MNNIHPRFVNREDELERIRKHIEAWDTTRILVIDGPGGVGKTRLLEKVYETRGEYQQALGDRLISTKVINLDDIRLQMYMNLGRQIAHELDPQRFRRYLEDTDRLVLEESKGLLTPEVFERYVHEGDLLFLQAYNEIAQEKRILLLADTMEAVLHLPAGRYLAKMAALLENTCVLVAGREGKDTKKLIEQALKQTGRQGQAILDHLLLKNFEPRAMDEYLGQTPIKGYLEAQPHLYENLLLMTEGKPLLLALAVEWLLRDLPLPEMVERSSDELRAIKLADPEELQKRFESALIAHVRDLKDPLGEVVLDMAHLYYRFDAAILAAIAGWSEAESQQQLGQMSGLFFTKTKPDGVLVLHDEVARLVREYVWPEVDPFGTRRRQINQQAIEHYQSRLQDLTRQMRQAQKEAQTAASQRDLARASESWRYWAEMKRGQWTLTRELLHYTLEVDLQAGQALFMREFDQATDEYQFLFRRPLVEEIARYEERFTGNERYDISIRIAKCQLDEAEYQDAYDKIKTLLETLPYQDEHRVDSLIQLANSAIRLGRLEEGHRHFEEALKICEESRLPQKWWAMVVNGLGWACRLLGQWNEAIRHWNRALDYSVKVGDRKRLALVLNNLGYVYHLKGDGRSGLALSQQALEIAQSLGYGRQIAMNHSTLGEIHLALDQYEEAFAHYGEALALFEREADEEWMAVVYHELSRAKRHQAFDEVETPIEQREARLEEALRYAERSLQLCEDYHLLKEAPAIYYGIGSIEADLGHIEKAKGYLIKSYGLNKEGAETFGLMVDLAALAELAYTGKNVERIHKIVEEARQLMADEKIRADYPLFFGRTLRILAEVYLDDQNYEQALETYIEALPHIGRHGGYGKYRFDREVKRLQDRIAQLPEEVRGDWCNHFIERWQADSTLASEHPEVVTACRLAQITVRSKRPLGKGGPQ